VFPNAELVTIRPKLTLRVRCFVGGSDHARSSMVPLHRESARDALRKQEDLCAAWCREKARPLGRALNEYLTPPRRGGKLRQGMHSMALFVERLTPKIQSYSVTRAISFTDPREAWTRHRLYRACHFNIE
jgi:hypothetical protein